MSSARRLAAIDVGSNTIHLLVADCLPGKAPQHFTRRREFVQLGLDVAATGTIGPERLARAAQTLRGQLEEARRAGAGAVAIGATQALRSARGGERLALELAAAAGAERVHILPAPVEAQLAFDGATLSQPRGSTVLLLDIGGASAQLALGPAGGLCQDHSLPIGSGNIASLAPSDPPTEEEWRAMERRVGELIPDLVPPPPGVTALGTGGTITNLPRLIGKPKGAQLRLRDVEQMIEIFHELPVATVAEGSRVDLERARLCRGGALILAQMMDLLDLRRLRCSERGLRDGMVMALDRRGEERWFAEEDASGDGSDSDLAALVLSGG